MREILDYCTGGIQRAVPAGTVLLHQGTKTGRLFVLIEGRLEVIRGDAVVAVLTDPGAVTGEMSLLLDRPHTATVRAASDSTICEFSDAASFLNEQPAAALLISERIAEWLESGTWSFRCGLGAAVMARLDRAVPRGTPRRGPL